MDPKLPMTHWGSNSSSPDDNGAQALPSAYQQHEIEEEDPSNLSMTLPAAAADAPSLPLADPGQGDDLQSHHSLPAGTNAVGYNSAFSPGASSYYGGAGVADTAARRLQLGTPSADQRVAQTGPAPANATAAGRTRFATLPATAQRPGGAAGYYPPIPASSASLPSLLNPAAAPATGPSVYVVGPTSGSVTTVMHVDGVNPLLLHQPGGEAAHTPAAGHEMLMGDEEGALEVEELGQGGMGSDAGGGGEDDEEEEEDEEPLIRAKPSPVVHKWNWWPLFLLLAFLASAGFYFYVRITQQPSIYGYVILAVELLGVTSFLPYAVLLTRGVYPNPECSGLPAAGSPEALVMSPPPKTPNPLRKSHFAAAITASPAPYKAYSADITGVTVLAHTGVMPYPHPSTLATPAPPGSAAPPPPPASTFYDIDEPVRFHVRVLVPCYKEPLSVVAATLAAAQQALLPAYTKRTIYLCDDGKDAEKQRLCAGMGPDVIYVSGRRRKHGEVNGKSANLNNCLKNVIYAGWPRNEDTGDIDWSEISSKELVVVFDADMCAKPEFFVRMLEVMMDDSLALCLSPQSFHNINKDSDIFNNINKQFWECWLPGAFAWGYIACTGTNFCIRTRALAHCGWFPEYTITEDYALGMELKARGYTATYLMLYLATGEAPEEIRNVFRQRSRWTKGHFQVFLSRRNPLLNWHLPFFQRLWYSYAAWAPISTAITVPTFMLVPFMSVVFGYNPVTITFYFVLAATCYFTTLQLISNYCYFWGDWKQMWFANLSNTVLWFTYVKAFFNSILSAMGVKLIAFKVTEKVKPQADKLPIDQAERKGSVVMRAMSRLMGAFTPSKSPPSPAQPFITEMGPPTSYGTVRPKTKSRVGHTTASKYTPSLAAIEGSQSRSASPMIGAHRPGPHPVTALTHDDPHGYLPPPSTAKGSLAAMAAANTAAGLDHLPPRDQTTTMSTRPGTAATPHTMMTATGTTASRNTLMYLRGQELTLPAEKGKANGSDRALAVLASFKPANIADIGEMFDPLALLILFIFSTGTFGFGLWQVVTNINDRSYTSFAYNSPLKGSPYLVISVLWAFFNGIGPYLFLHYCISSGATFRFVAKYLMLASHAVLIGTLVLIWLLIPAQFDIAQPLALQFDSFYPGTLIQDSPAGVIQFVSGLTGAPMSLDLDPTYLAALATTLATTATAAAAAAGTAAAAALSSSTSSPSSSSPSYGHRASARRLLDSLLLGVEDASALSGFDPTTASEADIASWSRALLQAAGDAASASSGASGAGLQLPTPDLTGGLFVSDHVKYPQPMAYTITHLCWSLLEFPDGLSDAQKETARQVIRSGSSYLMRSLLRTKSGSFVYVAQVGDPTHYAVTQDPTQDLAGEGRIWTSPAQDPFLTGTLTRKAWVLSEDSVGSDLLGSVAAALAATGEVFSALDPSFSSLAISYAQKVYAFATLNSDTSTPQSYCRFVPCTANVTAKKQQLATPLERLRHNATSSGPVCYYVDWITKSCMIGSSVEQCAQIKAGQREVFTNKVSCCNLLSNLGVWSGLYTRAQGICAVPDNQWNCYVPDASQRTCYEQSINSTNGWGCVGQGVNVFATPLGCCNYLTSQGAIDADAGKTGSGMCARVNFDPTFQQCYVPSLSQATCVLTTGPACASFGAETSYSEPTACCNRLLEEFQQLGFNKQGGIQLAPMGICTLASTPESGPRTRKLASSTSTGRRALTQQATSSPSASSSSSSASSGSGVQVTISSSSSSSTPSASSIAIDNSTIWQAPLALIDTACTRGLCDILEVPTTTTITFYNSTSVLDDLAWGGAWLYRATGDSRFLGQSQKFLDRHYREDISPSTLISDRSYYAPDWNNLAWATNALLYKLTGNSAYDQRVRQLLTAWVYGSQVTSTTGLPPASSTVDMAAANALKPYNDTATGTSWLLIPECKATASYEDNCYDGIDNDCDGVIDKQDVDCGFFPVVYTPQQLAFSTSPSLPHTAYMSFLAVLYSKTLASTDSNVRELRCWALGQVSYMAGATPDTRSYVVGYGNNPPTIVQHRASSCPATTDDLLAAAANTTHAVNPLSTDVGGSITAHGSPLASQAAATAAALAASQLPCTWDNAYWPNVGNPQLGLINGALVSGPNVNDGYTDVRSNTQTAVTADGTVALTVALAALLDTSTSQNNCELHGIYSRYAGDSGGSF